MDRHAVSRLVPSAHHKVVNAELPRGHMIMLEVEIQSCHIEAVMQVTECAQQHDRTVASVSRCKTDFD